MEHFPTSLPLLEKELVFFKQYLDYFIHHAFAQPETSEEEKEKKPTPKKPETPIIEPDDQCLYAKLVYHADFQEEDRLSLRLFLLLALSPHFYPELLDVFFIKNEATGNIYTEFGGRIEQNPVKFRPTIQTFYFLLANNQLSKRTQLQEWLAKDGVLAQKNLIYLQRPEDDHSLASLDNEVIAPTEEFLTLLQGKTYIPQLSTSFPAELITTELTWNDVVLPEKTIFQLREIVTWMREKDLFLSQGHLKRMLRPGYRAVFHGESGTGKTMVAQVLAQEMGLPVLKVHTPMLMSKWVGETEKNLNNLFEQASGRDWVLLFDEGETLFGHRGGSSTQDQYANQQIGFLLQKIERHDGLVIISSNRYANIDKAFQRRFESIIYFESPKYEERLRLWQKMFEGIAVNHDVNFEEIAEHYPDMTGGRILNVLRSARIWSHQERRFDITLLDILRGIQKEVYKYKVGWQVKPPEEKAKLTPYLNDNLWI